MADRLIISELDFDSIKNNLKNFLRNQSEFTDYDFDGSGLSILLDILAYNTHYQAYYLNMLANESFLDTALLRDSVVSHAKALGYTPASRKAATASINLTVMGDNADPEILTLPYGTVFLSNQIDNKSYNFVTLEDIQVAKVGTNFYFEDVLIYEGQLNTLNFSYDESNNTKSVFLLPETNIDRDSITVSVLPSPESTSQTVYTLATELESIDGNSEVFFLQEERFGRYQIYFGNGVIGKKLPDGAVVKVRYLVTNGSDANKSSTFIMTQPLGNYTDFDVTTVKAASDGLDRETIDSIKYLAPLQYASQNRIVSFKDYDLYLKKNYPNLESISVWGGEDETPPIYGKVFVSLKPAAGYYISESEKEKIITEIVKPRSVVTVKTEFRDPEYLYLNLVVDLQYNPNKTILTPEALKAQVKSAILDYKNNFLNKFDSRFAISKMQEMIDAIEPNAIVGTDSEIRIQKRIIPVLNRISNYVVNFNVPLIQGTVFNKFNSSEFYVNDAQGIERKVTIEEVPKSFTGVNAIQVLDPGSGYTSTPTVTITGDGVGATAKAVLFLGKIQRIEVTNPGIDYNKATVTISGGGGTGATALAVIDTKIGKLRTVYYTPSAERVVVNNNVGEINYEAGIVTINDTNILRTDTSDGLIRLNCGTESSIIQATRNTILTFDENDSAAISVNLKTV